MVQRCQRPGCGHKLTEHGRNGAECERFNCSAGCRLFDRYAIATFTDKELEYIYQNCDFDPNDSTFKIFKQIEVKIRKQIPRLRDFDLARKKTK